ncbi:MAG: hypothetical protein LC772_11170 [Chloroflexi bacterium]|nr:hypothetical protein [Chloroflexota bacterium]
MKRISAGLFVGMMAVLLGLSIALHAHSMATTWESFGPGGRMGTTDPGQETTYRVLGFVILGFGLLVSAMAINHWMSGRDLGGVPRHPAGREEIEGRF